MTTAANTEAHRRMHRTTVLTVVVAVAPLCLVAIAVTSDAWWEALILGAGVLGTFPMLFDRDTAGTRAYSVYASLVSLLVWLACALTALNPFGFFGLALTGASLIARRRVRPLLLIPCLAVFVGAIGALALIRLPLDWEAVGRFVGLPMALTAFAAGVVLLIEQYWFILRDLERAQHAETELGIMRERMRFASDLHDIQGHTLHVVKLKVSVAEGLVRGTGAAGAPTLDELREVRELVGETIAQTRALAHAERRINLPAELENAKNLFEAAGIDVRVEGRLGRTFPDATEELLAQVLREATTNILRHAQAAEVRIALHERGIEIENDGVSAEGEPGLHGLLGLRERVAARGGALRIRRVSPRFVTAADFPRPAPASGASEREEDRA
ncbi:sensor histidine kinase [Gulosibacter sp. 10]|uniref:sensor histidine kinase n=1 Tax=Gulosibacter sp. 10 TaxID=1255570 RepID=UPI00097E8AAF|nr:histidine kinase [Gulosibacter sp. 10]SJM62608.1 putative two-component system sensor kinase [Gulosibacter sp. 10]